ncbi:MAG TPA: STAS domain-containing protein [Chitinispirillaceae bacterium]|nr:STAS domain-containing protein [Chitinispirillaceae bacterium]
MAEPFVDIQSDKALIHIEGAAVIDNAAKIHQVFMDAVESHLPVILDIEQMTECDSSFVQLLRSLCYTLNRGGNITLQFSQDRIPDAFRNILKMTGFQFHTTCTRVDNAECLFCKVAQSLEQKQGRN